MGVFPRSSRRFAAPLNRRVRAPLLLAAATLLALGGAGCASAGGGGGSGGPKGGPNLITADEIATTSVQTAYEAIQKLRPAMLRQRQVASANGQGGVGEGMPSAKGSGVTSGAVVVYMDNTRLGDVEQLRGISASSIASVRYFSASEAQTKWGSGHPGGAIEVVTKR